MLVELGGVEADAFIEGRPLVVVQVHGDVDGQAEELAPLAALPVIQELGLCLQDSAEEVTVPAGLWCNVSRLTTFCSTAISSGGLWSTLRNMQSGAHIKQS